MRRITGGRLLIILLVGIGVFVPVLQSCWDRMNPIPVAGREVCSVGQRLGCPSSRSVSCFGALGAVARNDLTLFEQTSICVASFGLKPLYELIALVIAWVIWKWPESHWRMLRWAMLVFFAGENACAVNYLFYGLENFTWEFWHCYGMLIAFGLTFLALLDFLDQQLIHYSQPDKACAWFSLCKSCYKHKPMACNMRMLFIYTVPGLVVLCAIPLSAPFLDFTCVGGVYGHDVVFTHALQQQLFEIRIYPILAMLCFAWVWIQLIRRKEAALVVSMPFLAAGLGLLGFSMMRFVLFWSFSGNILWAEVWEEITEFLFITLMVVLVRFRWSRGAAASCLP